MGKPIAWLAFAGFAFAALLLLVPLPLKSRFGSAAGDLAHAPMFGGITVAILLLWHRFRPLDSFGRRWLTRILAVVIGVFFLGILVELAQKWTGRTAAWHDVVANGLGIVASGLGCFAIVHHRYLPHRRVVTAIGVIAAVFALATAVARPISIVWDVVSVQAQYPMITSFESGWEPTKWYFDDSSATFVHEHTTDGELAMRWRIENAQTPAATLMELPSDWSDAQSLQLDVVLDPDFAGRATLFVKVMDHDHADYHEDVFRKEFQLTPGRSQRLTITRQEMIDGPDTRKLDLSQIKYVGLMCLRPEQSTWIDVDQIRVNVTALDRD